MSEHNGPNIVIVECLWKFFQSQEIHPKGIIFWIDTIKFSVDVCGSFWWYSIWRNSRLCRGDLWLIQREARPKSIISKPQRKSSDEGKPSWPHKHCHPFQIHTTLLLTILCWRDCWNVVYLYFSSYPRMNMHFRKKLRCTVRHYQDDDSLASWKVVALPSSRAHSMLSIDGGQVIVKEMVNETFTCESEPHERMPLHSTW